MQQSIEMLEIIVAGKILSKDLKIEDVFEKVWYPFTYKQLNPDAIEIPPYEEKQCYQLPSMQIKYRLAGLDGEATEDRIETLDRKESE